MKSLSWRREAPAGMTGMIEEEQAAAWAATTRGERMAECTDVFAPTRRMRARSVLLMKASMTYGGEAIG